MLKYTCTHRQQRACDTTRQRDEHKKKKNESREISLCRAHSYILYIDISTLPWKSFSASSEKHSRDSCEIDCTMRRPDDGPSLFHIFFDASFPYFAACVCFFFIVSIYPSPIHTLYLTIFFKAALDVTLVCFGIPRPSFY